ncbi:hypothetical protein CEUSTIGMA_g11016.t1 [Chlamydomonas eustigma]|uniref:Uncharacterized protein n=1 Tax=Chlamydomonas eustigma TaxID=1157962 RepID=A0A250XKH2_9CHLO|nr:hypothetical protein CEUSTIGMA_g11016.t1 [Chlamydomonas eustigma]|eukprot:GAX83591.1 hypothetical protein CEUSTIGMA_g11016.t1 [Chlamydomonas eustigma]
MDIYNARSVKLAESTKVRLYLPGLGSGTALQQDKPDGKSWTGDEDASIRYRKKLAEMEKLALASEPQPTDAVLVIEQQDKDYSTLYDDEDSEVESQEASSGMTYAAGVQLLPDSSKGSVHHGGQLCFTAAPQIDRDRVSPSSSVKSSDSAGRSPAACRDRIAGSASPTRTHRYPSLPPNQAPTVKVPIWEKQTLSSQAARAQGRAGNGVLLDHQQKQLSSSSGAPKIMKAVQGKTLVLGTDFLWESEDILLKDGRSVNNHSSSAAAVVETSGGSFSSFLNLQQQLLIGMKSPLMAATGGYPHNNHPPVASSSRQQHSSRYHKNPNRALSAHKSRPSGTASTAVSQHPAAGLIPRPVAPAAALSNAATASAGLIPRPVAPAAALSNAATASAGLSNAATASAGLSNAGQGSSN